MAARLIRLRMEVSNALMSAPQNLHATIQFIYLEEYKSLSEATSDGKMNHFEWTLNQDLRLIFKRFKRFKDFLGAMNKKEKYFSNMPFEP
jgi:hypothetical protein